MRFGECGDEGEGQERVRCKDEVEGNRVRAIE